MGFSNSNGKDSGAISLAKDIAFNNLSDNDVLAFDATRNKWQNKQFATNASASLATTTSAGTIQLAGDLAGTATNPTVPGLATKADDSSVVHLSGTETVAGSKDFTGGLTVNGASVVINSDTRLTDERTPLDSSVTAAKIAAGGLDPTTITGTALTQTTGDGRYIQSTQIGTASGVASLDGTGKVPASQLPAASDATTTAKGIVQLAGDLGGTSDAPTVPGLANKVDTSTVGLANGIASLDSTSKLLLAQVPDLSGIYTTAETFMTQSVSVMVEGAKGDYPGYPNVAPAGGATVNDDRAAIQAALNNAVVQGSSGSTSHYKYLDNVYTTVTLAPGNYYIGLADANGTSPSLVIPETVSFDYSRANLFFELPKTATYAWCGIQLSNYGHIRRGGTYVAPVRADGSANSAPDSNGFYDALRVVNTDGDSIVDDNHAVIASFPGAAVGLFGAYITGIIGGQIRSCVYDVRASNVYADNQFGITIPNETDAPSYNATYANVVRMNTDVFVWGKRHSIKCWNGGFVGTLKGQTGSEVVIDYSKYNLSLVAKDWIVEDTFGPAWTVASALYVSFTDIAAEEVGGTPAVAGANGVRPVVRIDNADRADFNGDFRYDCMGNVGNYPGPNGTSGIANPTTVIQATSTGSLMINGVRAHNTSILRTRTLAAAASAGDKTIQLTAAPAAAEEFVTQDNFETIIIDSWTGAGPYVCTLRTPLAGAHASGVTLAGSSMTLVEGTPSKSLQIGAVVAAPHDFVMGNGYFGAGVKSQTGRWQYPTALYNSTNSTQRYSWVDANGRMRTKATPPQTDTDGTSLHAPGVDRVPLLAGLYYWLQPGAQGTTTPSLGTLLAMPFSAGRTCTIDYLAVDVTAAGTGVTLRAQIVKDTGSGRPDLTNPLGTEATFSVTATGLAEFTPGASVTEGEQYWLLLTQQGTAAATLESCEINRTDIGFTSKPSASMFTGFSNCLVGGALVTSGAITATSQSNWDNTAPNKAIKVSVRASS